MSAPVIPLPAPPEPKCPHCGKAAHPELKARVNCAANHAARLELYAWAAQAHPDVTRAEVKGIFAALHKAVGHYNAIHATAVLLDAGWRPSEDGPA